MSGLFDVDGFRWDDPKKGQKIALVLSELVLRCRLEPMSGCKSKTPEIGVSVGTLSGVHDRKPDGPTERAAEKAMEPRFYTLVQHPATQKGVRLGRPCAKRLSTGLARRKPLQGTRHQTL